VGSTLEHPRALRGHGGRRRGSVGPRRRAPQKIKINPIAAAQLAFTASQTREGRVGLGRGWSSNGRGLPPRRPELETLDEAARALARDAGAFERLVSDTFPRLVRYAARIVGDIAEAEDVVQESYVKAYGALLSGSFEGRSSLTTWLHRIVTRTAIDVRRRRGRRETFDDVLPEAPFDGAAAADGHLALRELSAWLGELPEEQSAALLLQALEGFTNREIAEILECSEGAVEQRLVRARTALRKKEPE
jgi:RNA polymerase sigma-70 factor (ECF subfamily)